MPSSLRRRLRAGSWVAVTVLGLLVLLVPLYDMWDDLTDLSWGVTTTLVENSVLVVLALGLAYGGVWLAGKEWDDRYTWTVAKWNVGVAAGIAALYALVIALQLWAMGELKPWVLALDGVLFGSVVAFGVGVSNAYQQRAREELLESRERYRTITDDVLDTSEVATFVLDSEFRVVWINEATAEYFGLDREAAIGRDKRELIESEIEGIFEDPAEFSDRVTATYDDNTYTENFECHVLPGADREERWLEHWSQPIDSGLYAGGRIEHYTDITSQKERQRELDARQRRLREMYETVSDTSLAFEEKVDRLVGIGRDLFDAEYGAFSRVDRDTGEYHIEVVQSETGDIQPGDVVPLARTHCERTVGEGRTMQFEARPFAGDGDGAGADDDYGTDAGFEMYVGTPVYEGQTVYGTLCFLDRSEAEPFEEWQLTMVELMGNWMGYELNRKRLLEERRQRLREQEAKLEEFVDAVGEYAIFTLDTDGRITSWNRGAERIKGYDEAEAIGEHLSVFYPPDADSTAAELLERAAAEGQVNAEGPRVRKDGTRFWADVTLAARHDGTGDHVGYTKIVRDMTARREYQQALEHERERLEFMNRLIRHNLLNGLNLVDARAELLEDHVDDPDAAGHLDTIQDRVTDLSSLIDTMRTFMSAIVGDESHRTYPVALREQLDAKVELARSSYPGAVFDTGDLPDPDVEVVADELVGEVFENVLSNGVVHNDKDTPRVEVWTTETTCEVTLDPDTGEVVSGRSAEMREADPVVEERPAVAVHVADNGPGIPDDQKEAVLEKGVSGLSEPGNGFGLYLVKEMMAVYGGEVDVRDADIGGTRFDLVFPRAEE